MKAYDIKLEFEDGTTTNVQFAVKPNIGESIYIIRNNMYYKIVDIIYTYKYKMYIPYIIALKKI